MVQQTQLSRICLLGKLRTGSPGASLRRSSQIDKRCTRRNQPVRRHQLHTVHRQDGGCQCTRTKARPDDTTPRSRLRPDRSGLRSHMLPRPQGGTTPRGPRSQARTSKVPREHSDPLALTRRSLLRLAPRRTPPQPPQRTFLPRPCHPVQMCQWQPGENPRRRLGMRWMGRRRDRTSQRSSLRTRFQLGTFQVRKCRIRCGRRKRRFLVGKRHSHRLRHR